MLSELGRSLATAPAESKYSCFLAGRREKTASI